MLSAEVHPERTSAYQSGGIALLLAAAVILAALGFEYIAGYVPCPLCLDQRYAYYAGVPLLFVAMALVAEMPRLAALIFAVVAVAFLANASLGIYQSGAEWKLWPGPETCGALQALPTSAADLLNEAAEASVVRCDEASWRFAGLSFAGWNAVMSLAICTLALRAAVQCASRH
jgi:disulfide bond formation protein DsbB